jgi:hypothetical protein
MNVFRDVVLGVILAGVSVGASAQNLIYGDSAGSNRIDVINRDTGALIRSCSPAKGNGRGMVVVGAVGYFTTADSNIVYKIDMNTCADLGTAFTVTGASALSTIAFDGTNFWIGDYSGSNKAFYYSPTGTLLKTVTLANCGGSCDGLEYFNGKLISNRGDAASGGYDVYDTNGVLLTADFIGATSYSGTGIAFDGTNFYVSDIFNAKLQVYDGTTGAFVKTLTLTNGTGFLIEDLSTDYSQRVDTGGGGPTGPVQIPTLGEISLIALMLILAGFGALALRRRG